MNELCERCLWCGVDFYWMWCRKGTAPEYNEEYEVWECEHFEDAEEAELLARDRHNDYLCELAKDALKGVSDERY